MAETGIALGAVSSTAGLVNSIQQAEAQKKQSEFMASQQAFNKQFAAGQAKDAVLKGEIDTQKIQRKAAQVQGAQRASAAAQGIDVNFGSAAQLQRDTAEMSAEDIIQIRNNAAREAFGYEAQSSQYGIQSQMTRIAGENMYRNTLLTGGIDFVRGIGKTSNDYSDYKWRSQSDSGNPNRKG